MKFWISSAILKPLAISKPPEGTLWKCVTVEFWIFQNRRRRKFWKGTLLKCVGMEFWILLLVYFGHMKTTGGKFFGKEHFWNVLEIKIELWTVLSSDIHDISDIKPYQDLACRLATFWIWVLGPLYPFWSFGLRPHNRFKGPSPLRAPSHQS